VTALAQGTRQSAGHDLHACSWQAGQKHFNTQSAAAHAESRSPA
jgi:hypothetical protein